jgi:hypothetical protein
MSHDTHHDPEETVPVEAPAGLAYLQGLLAVLFLCDVALLALARALPEWRGISLTMAICGVVIFLLALPKTLRFPGLPVAEKTVSVVLVLLAAATVIMGLGTYL